MFIAYKTLWCTDIHYKMRTKIRFFFELTNHLSSYLHFGREIRTFVVG